MIFVVIRLLFFNVIQCAICNEIPNVLNLEQFKWIFDLSGPSGQFHQIQFHDSLKERKNRKKERETKRKTKLWASERKEIKLLGNSRVKYTLNFHSRQRSFDSICVRKRALARLFRFACVCVWFVFSFLFSLIHCDEWFWIESIIWMHLIDNNIRMLLSI